SLVAPSVHLPSEEPALSRGLLPRYHTPHRRHPGRRSAANRDPARNGSRSRRPIRSGRGAGPARRVSLATAERWVPAAAGMTAVVVGRCELHRTLCPPPL